MFLDKIILHSMLLCDLLENSNDFGFVFERRAEKNVKKKNEKKKLETNRVQKEFGLNFYWKQRKTEKEITKNKISPVNSTRNGWVKWFIFKIHMDGNEWN